MCSDQAPMSRLQASVHNTIEDTLLSRKEVAHRWSCSISSIKRREASGILHPLRFSQRQLRFKLSDVIAAERAAGGVQ